MKKSTKIMLAIIGLIMICVLAAVLGWWVGKNRQEEENAAVSGGASVVTDAPENTTEPQEKEEAEETAEPDTEKEPEETEAPEATQMPDNTEEPVATEAPEETEEAKATAAPDATKEPAGQESLKPDGISQLHVDGVKLCDATGNQVQLRGISTHGIAWFPQFVNEQAIKEVKEVWKADVIRLAMYTAEYGGYCTGGDKEALKQLVKNGVEYAVKYDLYVIIDWHILSDNNPNTYKEEAKAFFDEMSELYKDCPNVIYEICNEPNGGTSWKEVKAYAEEVIAVIRENDEDNIIIVGTPNWCQYVDQAAADPITSYDNIMYALHYYAATHKEDLRKKMVNAINAGLPIFVSEYGTCDASGNGAIDEKQANAWVEEMDRYGISYVAWNLSNKNETSALISSGCNKTSGFAWEDLSASGKWLFTVLTGESGFTGSMPEGTGSGNTASGGTAQAPQQSTSEVVTSGAVEVTLELKDSWESEGQICYNYNVTLKNTSNSALEGWNVAVTFNENISLNQGWSGTYNINGNVLQISPVNYNTAIGAGQSISDIGFIICGSQNLQVVN